MSNEGGKLRQLKAPGFTELGSAFEKQKTAEGLDKAWELGKGITRDQAVCSE